MHFDEKWGKASLHDGFLVCVLLTTALLLLSCTIEMCTGRPGLAPPTQMDMAVQAHIPYPQEPEPPVVPGLVPQPQVAQVCVILWIEGALGAGPDYAVVVQIASFQRFSGLVASA